MRFIYRTAAILCICHICAGLSCQPPAPSIRENEAKIQALFSRFSTSTSDEYNRVLNDSVSYLLKETLEMQGSFDYAFDSLKYIGKIQSDDRKVRFYSWNVELNNGTSDYYGFIQYKKNNNIFLFQLTDQSDSLMNPQFAFLKSGLWYGSLVYDIIDKKSGEDTYYTLLCYHPLDIFVTRKLIDILWFDNNLPVFGKPVFHYKGNLQHRIIFEYSAKVRMGLTWNRSMDMIVFDHLVPTNPSFKDNPRFYGPDLSFDALSFEKGLWEHKENVTPRNEGK